MCDWFVEGSDPGLCVATDVPDEVVAFGQRCKTAFVLQESARRLAAKHGLHLEGLGGTEDGVVGALAAVGLAATGNDGRIVQLGEWPDDLSGPQPAGVLQERHVELRDMETDRCVEADYVDVGKHLRPNLRNGRAVLFVRPRRQENEKTVYEAVRLT